MTLHEEISVNQVIYRKFPLQSINDGTTWEFLKIKCNYLFDKSFSI